MAKRFAYTHKGVLIGAGWKKSNGQGQPLTWYKAYFDAPEGNDPVAIELGTMSKGIAWVNGKSIGRYWSSFLSPLGKPSQDMYHIPRAFIKPSDNLLVLLEEIGGNPKGVQILTVNRNLICSYITEGHPPSVKSWKTKAGKISTATGDTKPVAELQCSGQKNIVRVEFASYGNPGGACGDYVAGNCSSSDAQKVVEQYCLGKNKCSIPVDQGIFEKNGAVCPGIRKTLAVQVRCSDDENLSQKR